MEASNVITLHNGRTNFIPIKLKAEWMGHPKGAILTIREDAVKLLVARGSAVVIQPKLAKSKEVSEPKKDKMMRPARIKAL